MIGRDASTVHRAEKMHPTSKLETYRLCADALNVTLADLFCDDLTPVERELVKAFRATAEDQRLIYRALIDQAKARDPASEQ